MRKILHSISIVTVLLLLLVFPVSVLADGGGTTAPTSGGSLGKTTVTIVGDAVQFRPCSFEATFAVDDPDNNFNLFQKASGRFPTYHNIKGNTLAGDPALSGDLSTCDRDVWTSTVVAVDDGGLSGAASDPLVLECRIDRDDIPTDPIFSGATEQPTRIPGAIRSQPGAIGGVASGCCWDISLSSSTPGGESNIYFEMVSGDLPPGVSRSGDTIRGCTGAMPTYISGNTTITANDIAPRQTIWTSDWIARNGNNRCEISGKSRLTLICNMMYY